MKPFDFRVRALIVHKAVIYSPNLASEREAFYRQFIRAMIEQDRGDLVGAKVTIDGSGDRMFQNDLKRFIKAGAAPGAIEEVRLRDSRRDPLIQLADMCVGAIARSYRDHRAHRDRWRDMLADKIEDVWDFR